MRELSSTVGDEALKGSKSMELKFMWKDPNSASGNCPALYETEGGYVVQGVKLDETTRNQLRDLAEHEDGVFVPAAVLDMLRKA